MKNIIRNGGFESGDLTHWDEIEALTYEVYCSQPGGASCSLILGMNPYETAYALHNDYVPVTERDVIELVIKGYVFPYIEGSAYMSFYNAELQPISNKYYVVGEIGGEGFYSTARFTAPEGAFYYRPGIWARNISAGFSSIFVDFISIINSSYSDGRVRKVNIFEGSLVGTGDSTIADPKYIPVLNKTWAAISYAPVSPGVTGVTVRLLMIDTHNNPMLVLESNLGALSELKIEPIETPLIGGVWAEWDIAGTAPIISLSVDVLTM